MFCTQCGEKLKEQAKFCSHCGHPFNNITQQNEEQKKEARDIEKGDAKLEKWVKMATYFFLVIGILTLINKITPIVIKICVGLYSSSMLSVETSSAIIAINNIITNIWYVWLLIGFILLAINRFFLKNNN